MNQSIFKFSKIFNHVLLIATIFTSPSAFAQTTFPQQAFVSIPVADCLRDSATTIVPDDQIQSLYANLSTSPETGDNACLRAKQLLYNQEVTVINESTYEYKIKVPNFYYVKQSTLFQVKHSTYWVLKSSLTLFSNLPKRIIELQPKDTFIPTQIDYTQPISKYRNRWIIVLIAPWQDETTNTIYSAGTRFVTTLINSNERIDCLAHFSKDPESIQFYDPINKYINTASIDSSLFLYEDPQYYIPFAENLIPLRGEKVSRKKFVSILNKFADLAVPFVWGGYSFTHPLIDQSAQLEQSTIDDQACTSWQRTNAPRPQTGVDNSGLMLLAAQIAGFHSNGTIYPFANTQTLSQGLRKIRTGEPIQEGDFIWFKGFVGAVSSLENNQFITAGGFSSGYQSVVRLPLNNYFQNITSYSDLRKHYDGCDINGNPIGDGTVNKEPLFEIKKDGSVARTIDEIHFMTFNLETQKSRSRFKMTGLTLFNISF